MVVLAPVSCFLFWYMVRPSKHPSNAIEMLLWGKELAREWMEEHGEK